MTTRKAGGDGPATAPSKRGAAPKPRTSYKFKPEYVAQAEKLCAIGATDAEIAHFFEVSRQTLHTWRNVHPELAAVMKVGKETADDRVERALHERAVGYVYTEKQAVKVKAGQNRERVETVEVERYVPGDVTAQIRWLVNRRRESWKDKQQVEHSGPNGGPIEYRNLSDEEVDARIAALLGSGGDSKPVD